MRKICPIKNNSTRSITCVVNFYFRPGKGMNADIDLFVDRGHITNQNPPIPGGGKLSTLLWKNYRHYCGKNYTNVEKLSREKVHFSLTHHRHHYHEATTTMHQCTTLTYRPTAWRISHRIIELSICR